MSNHVKKIRQVVETLLLENAVEFAPVPVEKIAKMQGIEVVLEKFEDANISGFLYRDHDRAIVGINPSNHPNRRRFTLAHELGHFFLHQKLNEVHVDRDRDFQVKLRDNTSSKGIDPEEVEANRFAAELLMPVKFIEEDLKQMDEIDLLNEDALKKFARKYGVSLQAFILRLANLGKISY
jgi:Zn-dependent peptidase ImmA (M78 family)